MAVSGIEQGLVGQGSRGDHPDDVALDQSLGQLRVFELLADRRAEAGLDDLGQVRFERRVGEAGHRHGLIALVPIAGGQGDSQQGRGPLGILAEQLVEVSHPEEQQGVGIAGLELAILLHHRCQRGLAHETMQRRRSRTQPAVSRC